MHNLNMKKIIIIGSSSGIGEALALECIKKNHIVGLASRNIDKLSKIKSQKNENVFIEKMDLLNINESKTAFLSLINKLNGVDIVIINSGIGYENEELDFSLEQNTLDVNVKGFTLIADLSTTFFEKQGFGHIVGVSSIAGIKPLGTAHAYSASKKYISFYLESLRIRFLKNKKKISVTDIRPGFVDTPLVSENKKMFWVSSPEKAAIQILKAIEAKKKIAYITKRWIFIAWLIKITPSFLFKYLT